MSLAERLTDVMRAECAGKDLRDGPFGVHVFAMRQDGSLYELGHVTGKLVAQDTEGARAAINRIKFTHPTKDAK